MKTSLKLFALGLVLVGFGAKANAQQVGTVNGTGSATIVQPITIAVVAGNGGLMKFGNIAVDATTGGTVLLAAADASRTPGGEVTLPAVTGDVQTASFTITGVEDYAYSLTLPDDTDVVLEGAGDDMPVTSFTQDGSTGVLVGGTETITVGATLNVNGGQTVGAYSGSFTITVQYE